MNLLISEALADNTAPAAGAAATQNPIGFWVMIAVMFGAFYYFVIRPQNKRAKEHKQMVDGLAKGDEVIAGSGLLGRVTGLGEGYVTVEIADGVEVKVQRQAVQTVLPKGTIKSA
jgi:preprotein translocase subunit YajC